MNYEDIDHLLPRYCEGLATEEECRQVESWMEESEDNRKIVDQINTLYIAVDTVNVMRKVDMEKALKKREAQAVVIEEMRRTGKIIPRIGKTKSPLTH